MRTDLVVDALLCEILRTPSTFENVEAVRRSFLKLPQRSPRKNSAAFELSALTTIRIFTLDLLLYSNKTLVEYKLFALDFQDCLALFLSSLEAIPENTIVFFSSDALYHLPGFQQTLALFTKGLSIKI